MLKKILIANRGEIARRVIRTAHRLGIATVAVYSDADKHALYVSEAGEAIRIGPPPATESYLSIENIIAAARLSGADAIHPGYGFLSENADFADACAQAGIIFIGPSAEVIRKMGSKESAKAIMAASDVPVVPGAEDNRDASALNKAAQEIGLPILIKAVAGGGGRGMRLVRKIEDFDSALNSARREAAAAFGNDKVLLEKYIEQPRHIEVQIFGDQHGNVIHAFERDCSTQRRYQKVIEEAPAANLSNEQRAHLYQAAVKAGQAVGYQGAGTVEFVMDQAGEIYFIEMNTRLQVEHPVTEAICGEDLVAWQLQIASGLALPAQSSIVQTGHALELRLCAEDPANDFAPSTGAIEYLHFPEEGPEVRIDTGVQQGAEISPFYDSMFAKLIVKGSDRDEAIKRALSSLEKIQLGGLHSNVNFLKNILRHERFIKCEFDTHFVDTAQQLLTEEPPLSSTEIALISLALYETDHLTDVMATSPWETLIGYRVNLPYQRVIEFTHRDKAIHAMISMHAGAPSRHVSINDETLHAELVGLSTNRISATLGGVLLHADFYRSLENLYFFGHDRSVVVKVQVSDYSGESEGGAGRLMAPMPGAILEVFVEENQSVTAGTPLMLMEAMKIEHTITAPFDGIVTEIRFRAGEQVTAEGVQLIVLEPQDKDLAG